MAGSADSHSRELHSVCEEGNGVADLPLEENDFAGAVEQPSTSPGWLEHPDSSYCSVDNNKDLWNPNNEGRDHWLFPSFRRRNNVGQGEENTVSHRMSNVNKARAIARSLTVCISRLTI